MLINRILIFILIYFFIQDIVNWNSLGFSIAQLETTQDITLNGTWERHDGQQVIISQEGSNVIASFLEGAGTCEEFGLIGEEFESKFDFEGTLKDGKIVGEDNMCYYGSLNQSENGLFLDKAEYTINKNGTELEGFIINRYTGEQTPSSFIKVGIEQEDPDLELKTDRGKYQSGQIVHLSGKVSDILPGTDQTVLLEIYDPLNRGYASQNVNLNPDGSYSYDLNIANDTIKGNFSIVATYSGFSKSINFEYGVSLIPVEEIVIGGSVVAGVGSAATFVAFKQGYIKSPFGGSKTPEEILQDLGQSEGFEIDHTPTDFRIDINYGIIADKENSDENYTDLIGDVTPIEENFTKSIEFIQNTRKKIKRIEKDKEFVEWCIENRHKSKTILSKISNEHVINNLIELIKPYFINNIVKNISLSVNFETQESKIDLELNPIFSYIELSTYVGEIRTTSTRIIFVLNTSGKISKSIPSEATIKSDNTMPIEKGKKIEINDLSIKFEVVISEIFIGQTKKILDPVIKIGEKNFNIKK
ncbi:MAG: hypothetical protein ACE5SW_13330, partial [Nitrososphaeraceae archaeon]